MNGAFWYIRWAHKKLPNYPLLNNKSKIKTTTAADQEQKKKIRTTTLSETVDQEQERKNRTTTFSETADQEQKKKIRPTTLSDQQQINNNNKKIRTITDQDPLADQEDWQKKGGGEIYRPSNLPDHPRTRKKK